MREVKEHVIHGVTYKIQPLGSKEGKRGLVRLMRLWSSMSQGSLFDKLTDADIDYFCDAFAKTTQVEIGPGREVVLSGIFDQHFAGEYGAMMQWLVAGLETNYASFLAELANGEQMAAMVTRLTGTTLPDMSGSTGGSGESLAKVGGA